MDSQFFVCSIMIWTQIVLSSSNVNIYFIYNSNTYINWLCCYYWSLAFIHQKMTWPWTWRAEENVTKHGKLYINYQTSNLSIIRNLVNLSERWDQLEVPSLTSWVNGHLVTRYTVPVVYVILSRQSKALILSSIRHESRPFAAGGHVTIATLNQTAIMIK